MSGDVAAPDGGAAGSDGGDELSPEELRRKKVRKAKRAVRSELSVSGGDWARRGFAQSDVLDVAAVHDDLPRLDVRQPGAEALFRSQFEVPRVPCVLSHAMDTWPCFGGPQKWTWEDLRARFGEHRFKVGSDDDGYAVRLRFSHFCDYLEDPTVHGAAADDSPLYVFDGTFAERDSGGALLRDYVPPPLFADDLFALVGEKRRPPYRWIVFGPPRSGSSLHIDPLATSAWNALCQGRKRWVLIPPGTPRSAVKPKGVPDSSEAVGWFTHILPRCLAPDWPHGPVLQCIQHPGEVIFVPAGWWHAVLNLDATLAVTQNVATAANFESVWRHTRVARPKLAAKWLAQLRARRPELAAQADACEAAGYGDVSESSPSSSSSSTSSSASSDDEEPLPAQTQTQTHAVLPQKRASPVWDGQGATWSRRAAPATTTAA